MVTSALTKRRSASWAIRSSYPLFAKEGAGGVGVPMKLFNQQETKEKRKVLRKNQTDAEKKIWAKVRNRQISGYKFFRQYGIGQYIVDFYCPQLKLAIEIDGGQHYTEDGQAADQQREEYMKSAGVKTIRFSNSDCLKNIEGVFKQILMEIPPEQS